MSEPFIGEIIMFAGNFAPRGWAFCNGQILSIAQNSALFSILGTTYGGNGTTTFGLPDLRGRVPVGPSTSGGSGISNVAQGQMAGSPTTTLTAAQMPAHAHSFAVPCNNTASADVGTPANAFLAVTSSRSGGTSIYTATSDNTTMSPGQTGLAGSSQPVDITQPYLGINYIIALQGIFPSRN